ncbi:MAG: hypothetical protein WCT99_11605 [Bacteroidota bacterium]
MQKKSETGSNLGPLIAMQVRSAAVNVVQHCMRYSSNRTGRT